MNHDSSSELSNLVKQIQQIAALPQDAATSMPPKVFTSGELLDLERDKIFSKEWLCVGREDELQAPGDYFTTQVNQVPVIVTLEDQGEIRALVNVCRHRMSVIAKGRGKTRLFVCPYHSWSYDLNGNLVQAPGMKNNLFDKPNCKLTQLRTETWMGFVFINLDANAEALGPRLEPLKSEFNNYHVERMKTVWKKTVYWDTNWKILVENFLEFYHIQSVHGDTLYPYGDGEDCTIVEQTMTHNFYRQWQGDDVDETAFDNLISPDTLIANPDLTETERRSTPVGCIYPNLLVSVSWFGVLWICPQPVSTGKLRVDWGVIGPVKDLAVNADSYEQYSFPEFVNIVNNEDKPLVEAVYRGAMSGHAAVGSLHSNYERTVHYFIRYLSGKLASG